MEHVPEGGATGSEDLSSSMVLDLATATQIANSFNSPFFQVSHVWCECYTPVTRN